MEITTFVYVTIIFLISGVVSTSLEFVKRALQIDRKIAESLTTIKPKFQEEQVLIRKYLDEHEMLKSDLDWKSVVETVTEDPLLTFQVLRRLSIDYEALPKIIKKKLPEDINNSASTYSGSQLDYARSLIGLQRTHPHLTAKNFCQGRIGHVHSPAQLTVGDCMTFSILADEMNVTSLAFQWAEQAYRLCQKKYKALSPEEKKQIGGNICEKTTRSIYISFKIRLDKMAEKGKSEKKPENSVCDAIFNGKQLPKPRQGPKLRCGYVRSQQLILRRLREEIQREKPLLKTVHDVISRNEAEHLIQLAKNKESMVWLSKHQDPIVAQISSRIEHIAGIVAQDYQVVNYGCGGPNQTNFVEHLKPMKSERSVTLILYLRPAELGGSIVFSQHKQQQITIEPVQGSLVIWARNGEEDEAEQCPVIYGSQWNAYMTYQTTSPTSSLQ